MRARLDSEAGSAVETLHAPIAHSRRTVIVRSGLVLLLLLLSWWLAGRWYAAQIEAQARSAAAADAALQADALSAVFNKRLSRLQALTAFVETLPVGADVETDFTRYATRLFVETQGVHHFSLAPEGIVRSVVPESGSERLLGERLLDGANSSALAGDEITVSRLVELPGGEPGFQVSQAVYREGELWGLTSMTLNLSALLMDAGLAGKGSLAYALRQTDGTMLMGDPALFEGDIVTQAVSLPGGSWELGEAPQGGWTALTRPAVFPFLLASLAVVFLLAGLTYVMLDRQASLKQEVLARTRELALSNAQLEQRVVERTRELATLLDVAQSFTATLALQPLLDLILRRLKQEPGYTMAVLYTVDPEPATGDEGNREGPAATSEPVLRLLRADGGDAPPPDWHPLSLVVRERYPLRRTGGDGDAAWLVVPLQFRERVTGVLALVHRQVNRYDEHAAALVLAVASHAAVALENARLYERAQTLAVLEERQRLARELHDSVSQALYGVALGTRTARQWLAREDAAQAAVALDYVQPLTEAALTEMRALIFELRPESLAREGLAPALERLTASLRARHGVQVDIQTCPEPDMPLAIKEALYRVTQEALHNVARHADAEHVWLALTCDEGYLVLEIRDDGRGFDTARDYPGHLGLYSMRERIEQQGGQFTLQSAVGEGTLVRAALPLARWEITRQSSGSGRYRTRRA
jgi:signal transduction histidine kinase